MKPRENTPTDMSPMLTTPTAKFPMATMPTAVLLRLGQRAWENRIATSGRPQILQRLVKL